MTIALQQIVVPIVGGTLDETSLTDSAAWITALYGQVQAIRALGFACAAKAYTSLDVAQAIFGAEYPALGDITGGLAILYSGQIEVWVDTSLPASTVRLGSLP